MGQMEDVLGTTWEVTPSGSSTHRGSRRGDPVAAWLECVADDHKNLLPFFEHGEKVLLDEVYVELRLNERDADAGGERRGLFEVPVNLPLLLEQLDPENDAWVTGRWLLRGDPGAGKTTLLRHFASRLVRDKTRRWVPLFASLPRWLRGTGDFLEQADTRLGHRGFAAGALRETLDALAEEGRLLLLLDGLDEVPRESHDEVAGVLRDLDRRWPKAPIVVTTRPIGGFQPGERFQELDLLPFDGHQRRRFLRGWLERTKRQDGGKDDDRWDFFETLFGREAEPMDPEVCVAKLDALLDEDRGLRELAGNPLYLTLMALLLERGDRPARHRTQLYDQVFELLFKGGHRPDGEPLPNRRAAQDALGFVAYGMTLDDRDGEPFDSLEERLLAPEAKELRKRLAAEERWQRPLVFLEDVAHRTGILGPHDGPRADWRFWHRTFREALAAEELERRGEDRALGQAEKIAGDEGRWAEPYALFAGRLKTPDELVRKLVKANRALGLRAVATVQGLNEETLDEVLELTDDVKEREKVYARLPEMVGDGERVLALLERLRQRQRGGAELFFLHRAAREVAERWSELAGPARQFRARLFEHIQAPPPGLFETVETPRDGEVPLWREIPAGSFLMGNPEGEADRMGNETQHRVEITAPFRMAAVAVTNAQYAAFDPGHEWHAWKGVSRDELADHPVVNVTWYDATAFCLWLRSLPGMEGVRLPTEAEWEYACRAGTTTRYWSGDAKKDLKRIGWYAANSGKRTHRVGEKPANAWGLYDVHGNVLEWCEDWYGGYPSEPVTDPTGPVEGAFRVYRGGSWYGRAHNVRATFRRDGHPSVRWIGLGFRLARGQSAPGAEPK